MILAFLIWGSDIPYFVLWVWIIIMADIEERKSQELPEAVVKGLACKPGDCEF